MHTYKNISNETLNVIGFGVVKAGETLSTESIIENPLLKFVSTAEEQAPAVVATQAPQQNSITDVTPAPTPVTETTNKEIN